MATDVSKIERCFVCCKNNETSTNKNEATSLSVPIKSEDDGTENEVLRKQLLTIFLLKKLFSISEETCCQFLQQYGNPSSWIYWCDSCSVVVDEAKMLFDQIKIMERRIDILKHNLERKLTSSRTCDEQFSCQTKTTHHEPTEIVRTLIIQGILSNVNSPEVNVKTEEESDEVIQPECVLDDKSVSSSGEGHEWEPIESSDINDKAEFEEKYSVELQPKISSYKKKLKLKNKNRRKQILNISNSSVKTTFAKYANFRDTYQKCPLCAENFCTEEESYQHLLTHPPPCPYCEEQLLDRNEFRDHIKSHKGEEIKRSECSVCFKIFKNYLRILNHKCNRVIYDGAQNPRLKEKSVSALSNESISYDYSRCESELLYASLMFHKKMTPVNNFLCSYCPKAFNRNWRLQHHLLSHTEPNAKLFKCTICEKAFSFKHGLRHHENIHKEGNPFQCKICGKQLASSQGVTKHLLTHSDEVKERPFLCTTCGKSFPYIYSLKAHEKLHTGEKPYACEFCDKKFALKGALADHERIHSDEKPLACPFCEERFKYKLSYQRHLRSHTKEPAKYKCSFCDKRFEQPYLTKLHEQTHTGEKPHVCTICGLSFGKKGALDRHKRVVHDKVPGKYLCTVCAKRFHGIVDLKRHSKIHENNQ